LTWTLSWTWCNVVLDGSQEAKQFLNNLKINGSFQDPANWKVINWDEFKYEFNYKLGDNQYEFAYLMEPKEAWSLININKTYALDYQSWSLNSLSIDGSFPSVDKIITPIRFKNINSIIYGNLYQTWVVNWKEKIISFNKSTELNDKLKESLNSSGSSLSDNWTWPVNNHISFHSYNNQLKFNNKIWKKANWIATGEWMYFFKKIWNKFFYSYLMSPQTLYSTDLNIENQNIETNEFWYILKFENNVFTFYNRSSQNWNLIFEFYTYDIITKNKTLIWKSNEYSGGRNSGYTSVASIHWDKIYVFVTSPAWWQVCDKIDVYNLNDISFYTSLSLVYPWKTYPNEGLYPSYVNILNDGTVKIDYELVNWSWVPRKIWLDGSLNLLTGNETVEWYGNSINDMRNIDIMRNKYFEFSTINLSNTYPNITVTSGYYLENLDSYLIDNGGFSLIKASNDPYYKYNDWNYKSNEITNSNSGIYISINSIIPTGTDYKFYLANKNEEQILFPADASTNWNIDFMMNRIMNWNGTQTLSNGKTTDERLLWI